MMSFGGFSVFVAVQAIVAVFCIVLLVFPKSPLGGWLTWRKRGQLFGGWLIITSILNRNDSLYFAKRDYIAVGAILLLLTLVPLRPSKDDGNGDVR